MILADVILQPCKGVDPESLWWIIRGCWIFDSSAAAGIGAALLVAGLVGAQLFVASRQPRVK